MENFKNLNWSWKTALSPCEQFNAFTKIFPENDILYCNLNNIPINFNIPSLSTEYDKTSDRNSIVDPRNKNIIDEHEIDCTKQGINFKISQRYMKFTKKSSLNMKEHMVCLRVLKNLKLHNTILEYDQKIFDETIEKRKEENKLYMEFVTEKMSSQPMIKTVKELNDIYKLYLTNVSGSILTNTNLNFNLQTALPLSWCFETQNECVFNNCKIINQFGFIPKYKEIDFKSLTRNWDSNLYEFNDKNNFDTNVNDYNIIVPEETLIILLGALEDIPYSWDFIVEVQSIADNKFLKFHKPFPFRFINNITNTFIFEQKLKQGINESSEFDWIHMSNNEFIEIENEIKEYKAVDLNMNYKLYEIDEKKTDKRQEIKSNNIMLNCKLNNVKNGNILNLLVSSNLDFCNENDSNSYINLSSKLQYKKEFGSEIMTKYELLKEWLRQTLIPNSLTKRYHFDVSTFDTILKENITLMDIENDLKNLYNIQPIKLIGSLEEFFKILTSFPCDKYLVKFDPNHKTKLMLYKEERSIESKLSTHKLYNNILENCNAIQNQSIIPISSTVITPLHTRYQIMPACFPYSNIPQSSISNDRKLVIEKGQKRQEDVKLKFKKTNKKRKRKIGTKKNQIVKS